EVAYAPGADAMPGRSLGALRAYVHGWSELRAGRLDTATERFRTAAQLNPQFANASLWAAQSAAWANPGRTQRWRDDVESALRAGTLTGIDSALAVGLRAMAAEDYVAACSAFRRAAMIAPTSFSAWFDFGECARLDAIALST